MPHYCTKCQINWARLVEQDDQERDETYYFCPTCGSDMYLTDPLPGPLFISVMGRGIVNVETGEPLIKPYSCREVCIPLKPFDMEKWKKQNEHRMHVLDNAIDEYSKAINAGKSKAEAEQIYFQSLQSTS